MFHALLLPAFITLAPQTPLAMHGKRISAYEAHEMIRAHQEADPATRTAAFTVNGRPAAGVLFSAPAIQEIVNSPGVVHVLLRFGIRQDPKDPASAVGTIVITGLDAFGIETGDFADLGGLCDPRNGC